MRGKEVRQRKRRRSRQKPEEHRAAVGAGRGGRVREGGREGMLQGAEALGGLGVPCIRAPSENQPGKRPVNLAAYWVFGGPWRAVSEAPWRKKPGHVG